MPIKPTHKLLSIEKDDEYVKGTTDYLIKQSSFISDNKNRLQILYDAAEGILDTDSYSYVLNPYNTENEKLKRFPSKLRNYNIITPVLNLFLGEFGMKPKIPTVISVNADAPNVKNEAKLEAYKTVMAQDFINNLNGLGMETGVPSKEVPSYEEAGEEFESTYSDVRAQVGQEALDFLVYSLDTDHKFVKLFYDWLVCGRMFTYKDVYLNEVQYEVCDPRDIYVIGWGTTDYVEDADAVVYVRRMTPSTILDEFQDLIAEHKETEKLVQYLDEKTTGNSVINQAINVRDEDIRRRTNDRNEPDANQNYDDDFLVVYHCVWKSFTKVGILSYMDKFGYPQQKEVDDTYKLDKAAGDLDIEWQWINEVWESYQIEEDWNLGGAPIVVQRNKLNNFSTCKLPYNGVTLGYRRSQISSVVQQGLNYQVLYNIFSYRFELLLAKNKDKILAMPKGLIPDGKGWDTDKFMYWMAADGMLFYDDTKPKAANFINGIKSVDMSMGNMMQSMWDFKMKIKEEWWDSIGMNRQRYGDTFASDGKGNTEQAVARSGVITADMYRQADKFFETDWDGLLDVSKIAWVDGKKGMYINSDSKRAYLEIEGQGSLSYQESEFGVFAKNSTDELSKRNRAHDLILTMGQNGLTPDMMLEVLDANTIHQVKKLAKEGVKIQRQYEQQAAKQAQDAQAAVAQLNAQTVDKKIASDQAINSAKNDTDIEVALIQADASLFDVLNDTADMEDSVVGDESKNAASRMQERRDIQQQQQSNKQDSMQREQMDLKREDMANKMAIAKENKNKHDK